MNDNKNALKEIYKGCLMGIESIEQLEDKIENNEFKKDIKKLTRSYNKFIEKIENVYSNYSLEEVNDLNIFLKMMIDFMLNMKVIKDKSDSKIAEVLIQGINMGITEGRKIVNNKDINVEIKNIINSFINEQEQSIDELNNYL